MIRSPGASPRTTIAALAVLAAAALIALSTAAPLRAQQATLRGRVVTDTTDRPVAGAVVAIETLRLQATSDSLGNFELGGVRPGVHVVSVRKIGFTAFSQRFQFATNGVVDVDLVVDPVAQALPEAKVEVAPALNAKLSEFEERRLARAGGRFLTAADFEKKISSLTSEIIRTLPGIDFMRNPLRGTAQYVVGGRMQTPRGALQPGGNRTPVCFAAVVLDGVFVFSGLDGEPPFDINSISPAHIGGMEFYQSTASIPAKYSGTRNTCGLVVIWTR